MFRATGQLMYGSQIVLNDVNFLCSNQAGSNQGLVTNTGHAVAYEATVAEYIKFSELLGTRNQTWMMVFADGTKGEIIPQFPTEPLGGFPGPIEFSFRQNTLIK